MSISERLLLRRSATLFRTETGKQLPKTAIRTLFTNIVKQVDARVGPKVVQQSVPDGGTSLFSFLAFRRRHTPQFLPDSTVTDTVHGYCAILQRRNLVLIALSSFRWSSQLLPNRLTRLTRSEMHAFAGDGAIAHEMAAIRSADIADNGIRAQNVQARDLVESLNDSGASRRLLIRVGVDKPILRSTGYGFASANIRTAGGAVDHEQWCKWGTVVLEGAAHALTFGGESAFIRRYGFPLAVTDLPKGVTPTGVTHWMNNLTGVDTTDVDFFWKTKAKKSIKLSSRRVDAMLRSSTETLRLLAEPKNSWRVSTPGPFNDARLKVNKLSYSLSTSWSSRVFVRDKHVIDGELSLQQWISRRKALHVVFSDPTYTFSNGVLFADRGIGTQMQAVAGITVGLPGVTGGMTEKALTPSKKQFAVNGLFRQIELHLAGAEFLLCEDGSPEWADYIAVDRSGDVPVVYFVHAKAARDKILAPAEFEQVISQASKNLPRRYLRRRALESKRSRWNGKVSETSVQRMRRGTSVGGFIETLKMVAGDPSVRVEVVLAVNFLGRQQVCDIADRFAEGERLKPAEAQLGWLLTGFMSMCLAANTVPRIWCKE